MRPAITPIFNAADMTTTPTTSGVDASQMFAASVQAVTTGTATGTIKLQASDDLIGGSLRWSDIATVAVSGAGTYLIPKTELAYQYVRVTYVNTSGTGAISANLALKGF